MSRRPHHGVSSQSAATNSASRKVRNTSPRCGAAATVITVSTTSRHTRQRNTFGRSLTLGFAVSATRSASGRAACGKRLADVGWEVQEAAGDVGQGVEEQQRPGGADPAPGRAIPRLRRVPCISARTGPHDGDGLQPRCHLASLAAAHWREVVTSDRRTYRDDT